MAAIGSTTTREDRGGAARRAHAAGRDAPAADIVHCFHGLGVADVGPALGDGGSSCGHAAPSPPTVDIASSRDSSSSTSDNERELFAAHSVEPLQHKEHAPAEGSSTASVAASTPCAAPTTTESEVQVSPAPGELTSEGKLGSGAPDANAPILCSVPRDVSLAARQDKHYYLWLTRSTRAATCETCRSPVPANEYRVVYDPPQTMLGKNRHWQPILWKYYHIREGCLTPLAIQLEGVFRGAMEAPPPRRRSSSAGGGTCRSTSRLCPSASRRPVSRGRRPQLRRSDC